MPALLLQPGQTVQRDIPINATLRISNTLLDLENGAEIRDWALKDHLDNTIKREVRRSVRELPLGEAAPVVEPPAPEVTPSDLAYAAEIALPELPLNYVPQPIVLPTPERMVDLRLEPFVGMPITQETTHQMAAELTNRLNHQIAINEQNFVPNDPLPPVVLPDNAETAGDAPPPPFGNWHFGAFAATTTATTNYYTVGGTGAAAGVTGIGYGGTGATLNPYVHTVDGNLAYTINNYTGQFQYHLTNTTDQTYHVYTAAGTVPITFTGMAPGITFTVDSTGGFVNYTTPYGIYSPPTPEQLAQQAKDFIRGQMRNRLSSAKARQRNALVAKYTPQELKARDSLRDILSENAWRRYVTNGFIMAQGASGCHYQIFSNRSHTLVWDQGEKIASLCIHTDQQCPPTDHVINMKMLVEMDEEMIWRGANATWYKKPPVTDTGTFFVNANDLNIANGEIANVQGNIQIVGDNALTLEVTANGQVAWATPGAMVSAEKAKTSSLVDLFKAVKRTA